LKEISPNQFARRVMLKTIILFHNADVTVQTNH